MKIVVIVKYIKKIIVSTDNESTAFLAEELGASAPFIREKDYSEDYVSILDVFRLSLDKIENDGEIPDLVVGIEGHTDNVGNKIENLYLSKERAKSVYDYLIQSGVQKQRLSYEGFGEEIPIVSNDSEEGRALNRRTEFKVLRR